MEESKNGISLEEKAKRIFDALENFFNSPLDDGENFPLICITQEWKVKCDFGGFRADSDFVDSAQFLIEGKDDNGIVSFDLNLDFIKSKIPEIQKSLDESAAWCEKEYGKVPRHDEMIFNHVSHYFEIISALLEQALEKDDFKDWILEIDIPVQDAYLVKREMHSPGYGGLIKHFEISTFFRENSQEIDLSKVQELSDILVNDSDSVTGDFDPNDKGGELFQSLVPGYKTPTYEEKIEELKLQYDIESEEDLPDYCRMDIRMWFQDVIYDALKPIELYKDAKDYLLKLDMEHYTAEVIPCKEISQGSNEPFKYFKVSDFLAHNKKGTYIDYSVICKTAIDLFGC